MLIKECSNINTEILITEMGVSNEAKNVIPLKFLRKLKNFFFPLVNSIQGYKVCVYIFCVKNYRHVFIIKYLHLQSIF
jgi:hypothetical protein